MKEETANVQRVDCILIFMLDEEKELFLKNNEHFTILDTDTNGYTRFQFFDKDLKSRIGIMCSNGKKMGNTEACQLYYSISRYYKAQLYINLGLAGIIDKINIGDVIIVDSLSTMGENNASNSRKQIIDSFRNNPRCNQICNLIKNEYTDFTVFTKNQVAKFKQDLQEKDINYETAYKRNFKNNVITTGWCMTVPEVIKDKESYPEFDDLRKLSLIEMEAYYFSEWHKLVKIMEPNNSIETSEMFFIKSASDFGDDNKAIFEQCESRNIAMNNLYSVVSRLCTNIYEFTRAEDYDLYSYFKDVISNKSIDNIVKNYSVNMETYEAVFDNIIYCPSLVTRTHNFIEFSKSILFKENQALLLKGHSGVGKSTFLSYLYSVVSEERESILIDFSKFTDSLNPEINDIQIANLLCKLINKNNNFLLFLDGLYINSDAYKIIQDLFRNIDKYPNLSFCIGNISDDNMDELSNIVFNKKKMNYLQFVGTSIYSPNYTGMIDAFSKLFGASFNTKIIKKFISESEINTVDFRLINMIADFGGDIASKQNLYTFIKDYISGKFGISYISKYWDYFINDFDGQVSFIENEKINTYISSVAVSYGIIDAFSQNKCNEISKILKMNYILSDDTNLLFEDILSKKRNYSFIIKNIINSLKNGNPSISMETQLIYNICRTIKSDNIYYRVLRDFMIEKIDKIINTIENDTNNIYYYQYLIEYRTICIALNFCFGETKYLTEFNKKLINIAIYKNFNLAFHFFYYSKREFSFEDVIAFDLKNSNYEMCYNTYYKLKSSILKNTDQLFVELISNKPKILMDILTFLYLVEHMITLKKYFCDFNNEVKATLEHINSILEKVLEKIVNDDYKLINCSIKDLLKKLQ